MASLYNTKYYHRDLSWLRFNHRVLQEAADKRNPLYERIKFLAIYSSNLDEFFRVRVSDIRQIKSVEKPLRKKLITKPNKVLREIKKQVDLQQDEFGQIFQKQIMPDLEEENIFLIHHKQFTATQKEIAKSYYCDTLKDSLNTKKFDFKHSEPIFVENEALYLAGIVSETQYQLVEIPKDEPRFFVFPKMQGKYYITFIDDILKYNLNQTPEKEEKTVYFCIKISRDAELYIEDEFSGNLKDKIEQSLPKRATGQATRVLVDSAMPKTFVEILKNALDAIDDPTGSITFSTHRSGNHVIIDIADTGKGIEKRMKKDIFRPGYSTKKRGWGLGLSLAKRIVEDYHRGKLYVLESNVGKGTTFRIKIPA
ncbi:ATP-binding protein [Altibacter sp.]|uniref:ATP-binding protein n=1 Tax=Altibacter sp. TaxID=2024823 RepID=UPI0025904BB8|nr:ATP-binding protein [Altibacter sp.]MCW9036949.1 ATP-binding protein [Altibacter sp.]